MQVHAEHFPNPRARVGCGYLKDGPNICHAPLIPLVEQPALDFKVSWMERWSPQQLLTSVSSGHRVLLA